MDEIKTLQSKITWLQSRVAELESALGVKTKVDKDKLVSMLMSGASAKDASKDCDCSLSTAIKTMRQLINCGALPYKRKKKQAIIELIDNGLSDSDIAKASGASNGYVRNIRSQIK